MDMRYRLTQSGGAAWENYARPNWDWFLNGPRPRDASDTCAEIVSSLDACLCRGNQIRAIQVYSVTADCRTTKA